MREVALDFEHIFNCSPSPSLSAEEAIHIICHDAGNHTDEFELYNSYQERVQGIDDIEVAEFEDHSLENDIEVDKFEDNAEVNESELDNES